MEIEADASPKDAVDTILENWRRERPDLDTGPIGPIGRLLRCAVIVEQRIEEGLAAVGLRLWEYDMLATLRRSGAPYRLSPTDLFSTLMVTSGTMTHRLRRLETRGWIVRVPNEQDARSTLVQLSDTGLALIERAVVEHIENEHRILSGLTGDDIARLNAQLSTLLRALEK